MGWYEESLVYQIYPLGALDAPQLNDGTGPVEHRLRALSGDAWLDHLERLGVGCVLLNPVCESSVHGYDTRDWLAVDRRLGDACDLRTFVDACHARGMRVLLDGVFNHVGRDFWAFADVRERRGESPYASWFHIDWGADSPYGDGFAYGCWEGVDYLPRLNHDNLELNAYTGDVMRTWARGWGADGVRLDVAYCLPRGYLEYLRSVADELTAERGEEFVLVGETLHGDYNLWMGEKLCRSVTNYEAYKGLWSSLNERNMHEIAYALSRQSGPHEWDLYADKHLLNFLDNHDVPRIATKLVDARELPVAYGLLFGMRGVPCVYYGSEWGIEGEKLFGDRELRPAVSAPEWNELTDRIAALARARSGSRALVYGGYRELAVGPELLVFERAVEGERVIVAVNAGDAPAVAHFDAGCGRAVDLATGAEHDFGGGSELPAFSAAFWLCER